MKLYFGNMVTTVTTLMIVSLVGFIGYSISNRSSIYTDVLEKSKVHSVIIDFAVWL